MLYPFVKVFLLCFGFWCYSEEFFGRFSTLLDRVWAVSLLSVVQHVVTWRGGVFDSDLSRASGESEL